MSADNETLLEVIDSVAMDLTGATAQTSNVNPTKSSLIEKANDVQKDICNSRDWTFMFDTADLKGFSVATDMTIYRKSAVVDDNVLLSTVTYAGQTEYFAEAFTTSADHLSKPFSLVFFIQPTRTGTGAPSGVLSGAIHNDLNGEPDMTTAVISADALGFSVQGSAWTSNAFLFTGNTDVLLKSTKYWIVWKWVGAANNGDGIFLGYDNQSGTSTDTLTKIAGATTWIKFTTGHVHHIFTCYEADYITTLTMPTNVQKIFRLYSGSTINAPVNNLLPYSTTNFIRSPEDVPNGYFVIRKAPNGLLVVWINPATANQKDWVIEYKKSCVALSGDSDYSDIPRSYRALLKKGMLLYYVVMGLGMQDQGAIALLQAQYDKMLKDMRTEYLPNPMIRIGVSRRGGAPTDSSYNNYSPNTWSVK